MKIVAELPNGLRWLQIETQEEADREAQLAGHLVNRFYARDLALEAEGAAPVAYYSLRSGIGEGEATLATVRIPSDNHTPCVETGDQFEGILVCGTGMSNPYESHADAIGILSEALSVKLPRSCCPYRGNQMLAVPGGVRALVAQALMEAIASGQIPEDALVEGVVIVDGPDDVDPEVGPDFAAPPSRMLH